MSLPEVFAEQGWQAHFEHNGTWVMTEWVGPGLQPDQTTIDAAIAAYDENDRVMRDLRRVFVAFLKAYAQREGLTLDQVKTAIRAQL